MIPTMSSGATNQALFSSGSSMNHSLPDTEPDSADVFQFDRELSGENPNFPKASTETTTPGSEKPVAAPQPSLGDMILRGMKQISDVQEARFERIDEIIQRKKPGEEMDTADILRLQVEMLQLNMQHEITAKIASKTIDGIQTLFRNQ